MTAPRATAFVLPLADPAADLALVGGKGWSLARLAGAGLPVPPGFHVTTHAYRAFVEQNALQPAILDAVRGAPADASRQIAELFAAHEVPDEVAAAVRTAYRELDGVAVAVRSSATAEDLPEASFAGQHDTYLDVRGEAEVLDAVRRCWASLWTARAIGYRARRGIRAADVALAVVVQRMVPADAAGVLFTADPVTGADGRFVVNAVRGLGEALVSGEADPAVIVMDRDGRVVERQGGDPVVDDPAAGELVRLGSRIEALYGRPMDIEWVLTAGEVVVVQARPITVAAREEWNSSLAGDYLWTCANVGEAIPSVMTPATWSLVQIFMSEAMAVAGLGPHPMSGNIGGRFYLNLSVTMAAGTALGVGGLVRRASEQAFGRIPDEVEIPALPMSRWRILAELLPTVARSLWRIRAYQRDLPVRIEAVPDRCAQAEVAIARSSATDLLSLWRTTVEPLLRDTSRMLAVARLDGAGLVRVRRRLIRLAGEADTNVLLTGLSTSAGPLASLGPVVGLDRLARGEIDRDGFVRQWGHRCPDEFEISRPRPAEDPHWIDQELAGIRAAGTDVRALLERQAQARAAALERFRARHPRRVRALHRRLAGAARGARAREAARSEVIRAFGVLRRFVVRAGALTGAGDDLFFLSIGEVLDVLGGDPTALDRVPARRATYRRYATLPRYPTLIRGRFDPFRWAADTHRRTDVFDATRDLAPVAGAVTGFPGAAGVVEGTARVLTSVDQAAELRPGDVLVTSVTNVGWTPLFPRAAAVVTDIGAPLSHAAIVARELGIPAVVGTGNATGRLRTGDRLRVDGERGTVEVLIRPAG